MPHARRELMQSLLISRSLLLRPSRHLRLVTRHRPWQSPDIKLAANTSIHDEKIGFSKLHQLCLHSMLQKPLAVQALEHYLHPRASKTIGFPIDFQLVALACCKSHCLCQIFVNFLPTNLTKPLALPNCADRCCKKPYETIGLTKFPDFQSISKDT